MREGCILYTASAKQVCSIFFFARHRKFFPQRNAPGSDQLRDLLLRRPPPRGAAGVTYSSTEVAREGSVPSPLPTFFASAYAIAAPEMHALYYGAALESEVIPPAVQVHLPRQRCLDSRQNGVTNLITGTN